MEMDMSDKTDDTLLTPDNHALLMIDHQYLQLLALRSHPNEVVVNNSVFPGQGGQSIRRADAVHDCIR